MRQAMEKNEIESQITTFDLYATPVPDEFLKSKYCKWNFIMGILK
jgi:hypothetical protein